MLLRPLLKRLFLYHDKYFYTKPSGTLTVRPLETVFAQPTLWRYFYIFL
jgi:hypothetical protein